MIKREQGDEMTLAAEIDLMHTRLLHDLGHPSDRRINIALLSCDLESHLRVGGNPLYVNRT